MKFFIVLALFASVAVALPVEPQNAEITQYKSDNIGVDGYSYSFQTSDGKAAEETGTLKNAGTDNEAMEVRGFFKYSVEGIEYLVNYIANENGFQAQGAHLPVAPK